MERVEIRLRRRAPRRAVAMVAVLFGLWQFGSLQAAAMSTDADPAPADADDEPILPPDDGSDADDPGRAPQHTEGVAAGVTPAPLAIGVTSAGSTSAAAAGGGRPATRLRQMGSIPFPMEPRPRCEVLDSFGDSRSGGRAHEGVDILASLGQPVYAVVDGTLTKQYIDGVDSALSGNGWKLSTSDRSFFFYAHLSKFADGLVEGSKVLRGDLIGYVGDTGNPGPGNHHLHFEYHPQRGDAVNPLPLLDIPATCTLY